MLAFKAPHLCFSTVNVVKQPFDLFLGSLDLGFVVPESLRDVRVLFSFVFNLLTQVCRGLSLIEGGKSIWMHFSIRKFCD